jgi:hypothetical protein
MKVFNQSLRQQANAIGQCALIITTSILLLACKQKISKEKEA